ncbi:hypothetical protein E2C01_023141 [Portunus trituberculatus]|uniref:Ionotropic glutamate receptor L-glutamate and glycine-binding domain-containing protein n=1 Tax=Portunus trituberculatus TaxID=210409 RepID=A0A5B7E807_PORTR|nr:hypothetical protein [Portunus trituberculatus]
MNFTYTLTPKPPDLKWGIIENGSWVGLLGMIARGEKNFTINSFSLTEDRAQMFDSSPFIHFDRYSAFLPSPQQIPEWLSIFRPFTVGVLASLALTTAMCSILLFLKMSTVLCGKLNFLIFLRH